MPIDPKIFERLKQNDPTLLTLDLSYQGLVTDDIQAFFQASKENTYLTGLNISGNKIGDEGAILLAQLPTLTLLNISVNQVGEKGAIALAQNKNITLLNIAYNNIGNLGTIALAKNPQLIFLNLSGNGIDSEGISSFVNNTTLLHLVLTENDIDSMGAIFLSKNKNLVSLTLTKNQIGDLGAVALAQHAKLSSLTLCYNDIREKGGEALAQNNMLTLLDLSYNQIGAKAVHGFIKNKTLLSLSVAGNQINNWGLIALAQNTSITYMNLNYNQIGDEGVKALFNNTSLSQISLSYNQITSQGAKALAQHSKLNHLNISYNLLSDEGASILAESKNLTWLDVSGNQIGPLGAEALAKNTQLKTLILSANTVGDKGATALAHNRILAKLFLSYNQISNVGAIALSQNKTLETLNVNYNFIAEEGREALTQNQIFRSVFISTEQPPEFTSENLSTTFLLSQDFLCIRSIKGIIQFFNPAFSRVLDYSDDELLAKSFYEFLHPDDRLAEKKIIEENSKFPIYHHENRYRCKDGSYRTIRWSSQTKNARVYAVGTDITQQKQIEKELVQKEKKIQSDSILTKAAAIYTKEQTEFIAHLCHELRNPLSGIYGNVQMAQEYISSIQSFLNKEKQLTSTFVLQLNKELTAIRECHDAIITCTEYQKSILDDNLDLAKIVEKKFTLENKICDIKVAFQEIVKMFAGKAKQKELALNLKLPKGELVVKGDIGRIKQIIINLLGNAIKFTQSGHIDIVVVIQTKTAAYTEIKFSVIDSGIGMTEEEMIHLFERFSQANIAIGNQYGGSGLGLLIAKNLAHLMGGDIEMTSKKGEGSTFSCTIQCENYLIEEKDKKEVQDKIVTSTSNFFLSSPSISKNKVLIVDDNDMNRKILGFMLVKSGYECMFAIDGSDALEKFNDKPDIILMDIVMPKMDGITATKEIRKREIEKNLTRTPIIALTGNALDEQRLAAFEAGVNDYATKPYKKEEILAKILTLLDKPNNLLPNNKDVLPISKEKKEDKVNDLSLN